MPNGRHHFRANTRTSDPRRTGTHRTPRYTEQTTQAAVATQNEDCWLGTSTSLRYEWRPVTASPDRTVSYRQSAEIPFAYAVDVAPVTCRGLGSP